MMNALPDWVFLKLRAPCPKQARFGGELPATAIEDVATTSEPAFLCQA